MIDEIRKVIVRKVINVKVERYSEQPQRNQMASVATHQESAQFDSHRNMASQSGAVTSNPTGNVQVVRSTPKVGRNDPCPCGSGKKYKHCHGA